jgi:hypothetical protein
MSRACLAPMEYIVQTVCRDELCLDMSRRFLTDNFPKEGARSS